MPSFHRLRSSKLRQKEIRSNDMTELPAAKVKGKLVNQRSVEN